MFEIISYTLRTRPSRNKDNYRQNLI